MLFPHSALVTVFLAPDWKNTSTSGQFKIRKDELPFGVNVYGWLNGVFGVGEASRLTLRALEVAEIPSTAILLPTTGMHNQVNVIECVSNMVHNIDRCIMMHRLYRYISYSDMLCFPRMSGGMFLDSERERPSSHETW